MIFLSLRWETILEGGWTTSRPTAWRCGKETEILPHYFPWKELKLYIKKEEDKWKTIVIEHFNSILCHKSGPANKQHWTIFTYIWWKRRYSQITTWSYSSLQDDVASTWPLNESVGMEVFKEYTILSSNILIFFSTSWKLK